eukprot:324403-Chlamydomonas_euryale.AAC.3
MQTRCCHCRHARRRRHQLACLPPRRSVRARLRRPRLAGHTEHRRLPGDQAGAPSPPTAAVQTSPAARREAPSLSQTDPRPRRRRRRRGCPGRAAIHGVA